MDGVIGTGPWPGLIRTGSELIYDATKSLTVRTGIWYPTVVGTVSAGVATNLQSYARYTNIGNWWFLQFYVSWVSHTGSGAVQIKNLPARAIYLNESTGPQSPGFYGTASLTNYVPVVGTTPATGDHVVSIIHGNKLGGGFDNDGIAFKLSHQTSYLFIDTGSAAIDGSISYLSAEF